MSELLLLPKELLLLQQAEQQLLLHFAGPQVVGNRPHSTESRLLLLSQHRSLWSLPTRGREAPRPPPWAAGVPGALL